MSGTGGPDAVLDPPGIVPQRLRPPLSRPDQLRRLRLVEKVRRAGAPVVVLQAGAGYGKSTVLRQVATIDDRPFGWLTLDPADDDPVVFFRHLVRALADAGVDVADVATELAGPDPDVRRRVLPMLAGVLDRASRPFLLLLDDGHVVAHDESVRLVDEMIRLIPPGSTVVLAGRAMPDLRLARREVDGQVVRLDESDLAYTLDEAREVLRSAVPGLPLRVESEVLRITECWPAGLHLAILAVREHPDPPVVVDGLLSSDRRVADYLQEEGLSQLDPEVRRFLVEISVLGSVTGGLCDAVTGRSDSSRLLESVVASGNLFVSPVVAGGAYRLHQLFAELLQAELRATDPDREVEVRRSAARWYDTHGQSDAAVNQAIAAGDLAFAASVVHRHHAEVIQRGETMTLGRWLDAFPGDALVGDGHLAVAAGWLALMEGDRRAVSHHLEVARSHPASDVSPDGTISHGVAVAALELLAAMDGLDASARSAAVIVAAGPDGNPWWSLGRLQQAVVGVAAGRADPIEEFTGAELDTRGRPAVHSVAVAHLALAHLRAGERALADRLARSAIDEVHGNGLRSYSLTGMVHCVAGLTAAAVGDHARSRRHAADAENLLVVTRHLNPRAAVMSRQLLAEAALVRGEPDVAARLLPAARSNLGAEPGAIELERVQTDLESRLRAARAHPEVQELTAAELRVLELLPTYRSLEEIGEHLYVSRNTVKTHTLSIYRKLGVSSRSQAVERAGQLGVLEESDRTG